MADAEIAEQRVDRGRSDAGGDRKRYCERRGRNYLSKLCAAADQRRGQRYSDGCVRKHKPGPPLSE